MDVTIESITPNIVQSLRIEFRQYAISVGSLVRVCSAQGYAIY